MPAYWNFRRILCVDPDNDCLCVGMAKSQGRRCRNRIHISDRDTASDLLNDMDRSSCSRASEHLKELASLLLCKGVHNNHKSKAYLSQVREVRLMWMEMFAQYLVDMKEKEKKVKLGKERELRRVERNSRQLRVTYEVEEVEEEEEDEEEEDEEEEEKEEKEKEEQKPVVSISKEPKISTQTSPVPVATKPKVEDPFIASGGLRPARPNLFSNAPYQSKILTKSEEPLADGGSEVLRASARAAMEKLKKPIKVDLPSMSATPVVSSLHEDKDAQVQTTPSRTEVQRPIATQQPESAITKPSTTTTSSTTANSRTNFAFEFGSRSTTTKGIFDFSLPSKDDAPVKESEPLDGSQPTATKESFDLLLPSKDDAPVKATQLMENGSQSSVSGFKFGIQGSLPQKSFDLRIPRKFSYRMKPMEDSSPPFPEGQQNTSESRTPIKVTTASEPQPTERSSSKMLPITPLKPTSTTPPDSGIALDTPSSPQPQAITPTSHHPEENFFGYAEVTPNSTRYATYLPARQQYGLATPPETPERSIEGQGQQTDASKESPAEQWGRDYFADPTIAGMRGPRGKVSIARKPLPTPPSRQGEQREEWSQSSRQTVACCRACGSPSQDSGRSRCGCTPENEKENEDENNVKKVSCLHSLGLRRVKEKVVKKMKAVKGRVSRGVR